MVPLETDLCTLAHEFMRRPDKLFHGIVEIDDRCVVCVPVFVQGEHTTVESSKHFYSM